MNESSTNYTNTDGQNFILIGHDLMKRRIMSNSLLVAIKVTLGKVT
jgi:hypothetical protein